MLVGKLKIRKLVEEELAKFALKPSRKPARRPDGIRAPVRFQAASCNRKLSRVENYVTETGRIRQIPRAPFVSSTYASIDATCLDSCPWKGNGCYVDAGFTRFASGQMNDAARGLEALEVIRAEVASIDAAFPKGVPQDGARGGRDLRIHIGGDAPTDEAARLLAGAAERWRARGGGEVWSYTHSWRVVERASWGIISVLASVERPGDVEAAQLRGYAVAIVVQRFDGERAYALEGSPSKVIPCPAETKKATCAACRLCFDDAGLLERGRAIGFSIHGSQGGKVSRRLAVINDVQLALPGGHR